MSGEELLNSIIYNHFYNRIQDDPRPYWITGLFEGIRLRGTEREMLFSSIQLAHIPTKPLTNSNQINKRAKPFNTPFGIRIASLTPPGITFNGGGVSKPFKEVLFPTIQFTLKNPLNCDLIDFDSVDLLKHISYLLPGESLAKNSYVLRFNNITSTCNQFFDEVIIPCQELSRFYFFGSSNLNEAILTPGALNKVNNKIYDPRKSSKFYDKNNKPFHFILLRDEMSIFDAPIIARIAFSKEAKKAALMLNASIQYQKNGRAFPKCQFPFTDSTVLKANAMVLNIGSKKHLLIIELKSCTAPFPFENLATGHVLYESNHNSQNRIPRKPNKKHPIIDVKNPPKLDNESGGGFFGTHDLKVFQAFSRFSSLTKNIFVLNKKTKARYRKYGPAVTVIKSISTNSNKAGNPGTTRINNIITESSLEKISDEESKIKDISLLEGRFKIMVNIKNHLIKNGAKTEFIKWRSVNKDSPFTFFCGVGDEVSKWPFLNYSQGIRRRGLLLHIFYNNKSFYLLDIEVKKSERHSIKLFSCLDHSPISTGELEVILLGIIKNNGRIKKSSLPDKFKTKRIIHLNWPIERIVNKLFLFLEE